MSDKITELANIFYNHTHMDFLVDNIKDEDIFGNKVCMNARELVLILYNIEYKFNIKIPMQYLLKGEFRTFNNILDVIIACEKAIKTE